MTMIVRAITWSTLNGERLDHVVEPYGANWDLRSAAVEFGKALSTDTGEPVTCRLFEIEIDKPPLFWRAHNIASEMLLAGECEPTEEWEEIP